MSAELFGSHWTLEDLRNIATILTPVIAIVAGLIAIWAIRTQKLIATNRATIDVILKMHMDGSIITAREKFVEATLAIENYSLKAVSDEKLHAQHRTAIITYLMLIEVVASGVEKRTFDEKILIESWGPLLEFAFLASKEYVQQRRKTNNNKELYGASERLYEKWFGGSSNWKARLLSRARFVRFRRHSP